MLVMNMRAVNLMVVCLVLPLAATQQRLHAAPVNGGFESSLTGWAGMGDFGTVDGTFGSGPIAGSRSALVTSAGDTEGDTGLFGNAVPDADLETFLGLVPGALDILAASTISGAGATEGSAIKQSFVASAGDTVSFDFNFITTEATPGANDFAFVTIVVDGVLSILADTTTGPFSLSGATLPFDDFTVQSEVETGVLSFSHVLGTGGLVELGIGVMDQGDFIGTSGLLIDNVALTPAVSGPEVPEPTSMALFGLTALGMGVVRRRRKQAADEVA